MFQHVRGDPLFDIQKRLLFKILQPVDRIKCTRVASRINSDADFIKIPPLAKSIRSLPR